MIYSGIKLNILIDNLSKKIHYKYINIFRDDEYKYRTNVRLHGPYLYEKTNMFKSNEKLIICIFKYIYRKKIIY